MDRRDFIKNSLLLLGCSCVAGGAKSWLENTSEGIMLQGEFDGFKLKKDYLTERYKDKSELPKKIRIDACTLCQLNCPCCNLRTNPELVKNGCGLGYLPFEKYKKFVDEYTFEEIQLSQNGEIFLNPELYDIIKYSYKKNIDLVDYVGTNLNYLPDKVAEALVKYQFKCLTVSIDGATPEIYSIYRRGGDFNTVIENIKKINFYKKKYNSKYPELTYKFIVFGHNEHEIDKAKVLAKKLNMKMLFSQNFAPTYSPIRNLKLVKKKTGIDPEISYGYSMAAQYKENNIAWFPCKLLWYAPQLNWDGKVLGCCNVFAGDFGGNAFNDGLLNALNHPKMIYAKNMLTKNAKPIKGIPCSDCFIFPTLKKMNLVIDPKKIL